MACPYLCRWYAPPGGGTSRGGVARKKFIAVAGNIGAGKTELTSFLCRKYGLTPYFEPNDQNPYLADFYKDMKTWAFRSQIFFLTHKFRLHRELERTPGTVLQDRTIYEDAEIFAKNLHRQRFIDKRDWQTYRELYETVAQVAHAAGPDDLPALPGADAEGAHPAARPRHGEGHPDALPQAPQRPLRGVVQRLQDVARARAGRPTSWTT